MIDISKLDPKVKTTIMNLEKKPHIKYIRYLLTKRYLYASLHDELTKLGLSSPMREVVNVYYFNIIDPLVSKYKLQKYYKTYKQDMANPKKWNKKNVLAYSEFRDDLDSQTNFCLFVKELGIDSLWYAEIRKFFGNMADNTPVDPQTGFRILKDPSADGIGRGYEKIVTSPKRYVVDKLLVENVPIERIMKFCKEELKLKVSFYDIKCYSEYFFDMRSRSIEEQIHDLEIERNSLQQVISDLNRNITSRDIGERNALKVQATQRINELDETIKVLNSKFSTSLNKAVVGEMGTYEDMITGVLTNAFKRFKDLEQYTDVSTISSVEKLSKIMYGAIDKLDQAKRLSSEERAAGRTMVDLVRETTEEIYKEGVDQANKSLEDEGFEPLVQDIDPNEIEGVDELGVNIESSEEDGDLNG